MNNLPSLSPLTAAGVTTCPQQQQKTAFKAAILTHTAELNTQNKTVCEKA